MKKGEMRTMGDPTEIEKSYLGDNVYARACHAYGGIWVSEERERDGKYLVAEVYLSPDVLRELGDFCVKMAQDKIKDQARDAFMDATRRHLRLVPDCATPNDNAEIVDDETETADA